VSELTPFQLTLMTVFQRSTSVRSSVLYTILVLAIVLVITALPFVSVPISKQAPALLRPATEVSNVQSLINGRIKEMFAHENKAVIKDVVLYVLESEQLTERQQFLLSKKADLKQFVDDLKQLIGASKVPMLNTPLYQQGWNGYLQKLTESTIRLKKVQADFNRQKKLHTEKVIADAEFETSQFELSKTQGELELLKQNQLGQWQNELRNLERELLDIEGQLAQTEKEKINLVIKAPVSGSVQNVAGIYPGSPVFANQQLAQISPDTALVVEAYVSPSDIGYIRPNMPTRFQVNAFNYNQWGMATGTVWQISNDIFMVNEQPVFKVKCKLDQDYLQLKNGYKGYLKKGMTLQARFMVTERTLWQLLYDKADNWLNPNIGMAK
jgi:membrane fusion protein, peptide pheromone/bacteriocin exporter